MSNEKDESLFEVAQRAYQGDRLEDAERACRGALAVEGEQPHALVLLGAVLLRRGQHQEAVRVLDQALTLSPEDVAAWQWRSEALVRLGRLQDARQGLEQALALEPENLALLDTAGRIFLRQGNLGRASRCFQQCLQLNSDYRPALFRLGVCFYRDGFYDRALEVFSRFLELDPENVNAHVYKANCLLRSASIEAAEKAYHEVSTLPGGYNRAMQGLAGLSVECERSEDASVYLQKFEQAGGDALIAASMRARIAVLTGESQIARQNLRFILDQDPENLDAWVQLIELGPEYVNDRELRFLRHLTGRFVGKRRARAMFALAHLAENRQQREMQIKMLHQANAIQARGNEKQREEELALFQVMDQVVDEAWLETLPACPEDTDLRPIFICGMPRTGTTLTEQILASHSDVTPLAESFAAQAALAYAGQNLGVKDLSGVLQAAPERLPALIRQGYRDYLWNHEGVGQGVVTDKSMWLLPYLPLLYKAFPNATFVHVRRYPLDATLGCYKQLFDRGQAFSYTIEGCATYYARSEHLMSRYKALLPERIHELHYEALVSDQETVTRILLDKAGLAWEESTLEFHENKRSINTASSRQVRQALFSHAAGRWKEYGRLLDPFRQALEAQGVDCSRYGHDAGSGSVTPGIG